jgi:hypothetical protein
MMVLPLALRNAVAVGVRLLLLLLLRDAQDSIDTVRTGSLGVMVTPGVVLLPLYRGRWRMRDDGHRAGLLLLLLLSCTTRGLLLLLVVNMLRFLSSLVPDDPGTQHQGDNICASRSMNSKCGTFGFLYGEQEK